MAIQITNGGKIISFGSSKSEKQPKPTPVTAPVPEKILEDTAATDCVEDTAFPCLDDINAILNAEEKPPQQEEKDAVIVYKLVCSGCAIHGKIDSYTESYICPACGNMMNLFEIYVNFEQHSPQEISDALYDLYVSCNKNNKLAQKTWDLICIHHKNNRVFEDYKQEVMNKYAQVPQVRVSINYLIKAKNGMSLTHVSATLNGVSTVNTAMNQLQARHPGYEIKILSMKKLGVVTQDSAHISESKKKVEVQNDFLCLSKDGKTVTGVKDKRRSSYTIPDGVTSIGQSAFSGCKNLTEIIIPDSITSIGDAAFNECKNLTKITIPQSVTNIGMCAFSGCSKLTKITIPDNVTCIEMCTFDGCSSLISITIPDSVTCVEDYAFSECSNLTEITIPSSVTSIGENVFSGCKKLTVSMSLNTYTRLNTDKFNGDNIRGLHIKKNDSSEFKKSTSVRGENKFTGGNGQEKAHNLRSTIDVNIHDEFLYLSKNRKTVTGVKDKSRSSYTIPDGVTSIGQSAFSECSELTSIIIPDSITSIGGNAFSYCEKLTSIIIPDSVTSIGKEAFYECKNLTKITMQNVTSIGGDAFSGCSKLTRFTIPDSVTSIEKSLFYDCSALTKIIIPDGVTSIGNWAFSNCSSLNEIIIPDSVTNIGNWAFSRCTCLTELTIPKGVTSIGEGVFSNCKNLSKITIPDSVTSIGDGAFTDCTNLLEITIPDSVINLGKKMFKGCSKLTVTISQRTYKCLGENKFEGVKDVKFTR